MSTVGFTTTELFEAQVEALMQDNFAWSAKLHAIAARRLAAAYDKIIAALMKRGVSAVQAATWKLGEDFQLDIATYWFGVSQGWMKGPKEERNWLTVFDREAELADVQLLDTDFGEIAASADEPVVQVFNVSDDEE